MPKASVLQFDNYTVEELLFKKEPVKADQNEFQLQPHFEQEIVNLGDDKYDVHLSFDITPTEDHPMRFIFMLLLWDISLILIRMKQSMRI